jgi:4-diphosphocytidyl-2-C-methyl-D-erythritol kinase
MVTRRAYAKINLDLRVAALGGDGFHALSSWFVTVGLCDELTFADYPIPGIQLACDDHELVVDGRNLVVRAASDLLLSLAEDDPARNAGLAISLAKRIPTGGGLGGGSSDAAATLLGLVEHLNLACDPAHLHRLAQRLGSDVPFFLSPPSALCTGRGEVVDPLPPPKPPACLLVLPEVRMPTPAVFREFDRLGLGRVLPDRRLARADYSRAADLSAEGLLESLSNDLEPAAFSLVPELGELRDHIELRLSRPVRMSGSGSSLFTLFDSLSEAEAARDRLEQERTVVGRVLAVALCPEG